MSVAPYPLLMVPAIQSNPWGGTRIRDVLKKQIPAALVSQPIGESWEVSAHPNGVSRIGNGPCAGMTLPQAVEAWGTALVGADVVRRYGATFPLLVKLIDVNTLASVQVHPNDEQAQRLEGFPFGKSEAWYIIDAAPSAEAYIGFAPGTSPEQFTAALTGGRVRELLRPLTPHPGDCLALEPGTVHACGNGILMLEIQQSCDITYRVYDWDRRDFEEKPRALHIGKAMQTIDFGAQPRVFRARGTEDTACELMKGKHFSVFEVALRRSCALAARAVFTSLTVVRGSCVARAGGLDLPLATGATLLLPSGMACTLADGAATIVGTYPTV